MQHAVAAMFESKSCYASTIAMHMHDNGTTLKNREKKTLKRLEDTDNTSLNELLCKDGLRHMRNKKFYIAIDVTPIEKAFAKYEKDPTKESPMEGLGIIIDNAKKDGDKKVKGYELFVASFVSEDGKNTFLAGTTILNKKISISKNIIIENLLSLIFEEMKKQNKIPISVLADSGYDDQKIFNMIDKYGFDFTIKYQNTRNFNTYDSKTSCTMNNLTLDELYNVIDHKCYIEFYGHDATKYKGYLKYKPCFLNGFHKLVNIVILNLDGKLSALLTTNYVGSDEDAKNSVYRYNRRWNIELIFGFIKKTFNMEKYLVRTLKKMINLILLMMITTNFYSNIWYMKSKLKNKLIELAEPFTTPTFGLELIVNGIKELYKPNIKVSSS